MRSRFITFGKRVRRHLCHTQTWKWIGIGTLCLLYGFAVNWYGAYTWDDSWQYAYSKYLLYRFGLISHEHKPTLLLFGPLTELVLGLWTEYVFPWLKDPYWVRHAVVSAFYALGLVITWHGLRRAGLTAATATLAVCLVLGNIRLFGHSVTSVKDAPAATIFLVATVVLWNALSAERKATHASVMRVVGVSLLCIAVYLMRTPLLLHTVLAVSGFWIILFTKPARTPRDWCVYGAVPLAVSVLAVALLFPTAWDRGMSDAVMDSVNMYARHPWRGTTQLFGITMQADKLPWWYSLPWPAVIMEPFTFVLVVIGFCSFVPMTLARLRKMTFAHWMCLVTVGSWAAVCVSRPVLYNDERHIAFLFPPLAVCAALGLRHRPSSWQWLGAGIAACMSIVAMTQWGYQSYVYASPLATRVVNAGFDGDYWGSCIAQVINTLPTYAPPDAAVWVQSSNPVQHERLKSGLLRKRPEYASYKFSGGKPKTPSYFTIIFHGTGRQQNVTQLEKDIASGRAKAVWQLFLPSGQMACTLASYGQFPPPPRP